MKKRLPEEKLPEKHPPPDRSGEKFRKAADDFRRRLKENLGGQPSEELKRGERTKPLPVVPTESEPSMITSEKPSKYVPDKRKEINPKFRRAMQERLKAEKVKAFTEAEHKQERKMHEEQKEKELRLKELKKPEIKRLQEKAATKPTPFKGPGASK